MKSKWALDTNLLSYKSKCATSWLNMPNRTA